MDHAKKLRDDRIYELEEELRKMIEKIASLEKEILDLKSRLLEAPEVKRIAEAERTRFIYQEDPIVKQRNKDLIEEIEAMTVKHSLYYLKKILFSF